MASVKSNKMSTRDAAKTKRKNKNIYQDDMQRVKLKTVMGNLAKEITIPGKNGHLKFRFKDAVMSEELIASFRKLPRYEHLNMSTLACAHVIRSTYDDVIDDKDNVYFALMTVFNGTSLDFKKPVDTSNTDYIRLRVDILRYTKLLLSI